MRYASIFFLVISVLLMLVVIAGHSLSDEFRVDEKTFGFEQETISFGSQIEAEGTCLGNDFMSMSYESNRLQTIRINGKAINCDIELYLASPGSKSKIPELQGLKKGEHFRVRGVLSNAKSFGTKAVAYVLVDGTSNIELSPVRLKEFDARRVSLNGFALPKSHFQFGGAKEIAAVESLGPIPDRLIGRPIRVSGKVTQVDGQWRIADANWSPTELDDMEETSVALDGYLYTGIDSWDLAYQEKRIQLLVDHARPLMFDSIDHGRAVRIKGLLKGMLQPILDERQWEKRGKFSKEYVIKNTTFEYLDNAKDWFDRFGTIERHAPTRKNGVLVLVPEQAFTKNAMGNETDAMLYARKNHYLIHTILREASAETWSVIADRMVDDAIDPVLRLIYAAMLASTNDVRGQTFLLNAVQPNKGKVDANAIFCIGWAPFLNPQKPQNVKDQVDVAWAESWMLNAVVDQTPISFAKDGIPILYIGDDEKPIVMSQAIANYTSVTQALFRFGGKSSRDQLLKQCMESDRFSPELVPYFLQYMPLTKDMLFAFESKIKDKRMRRYLLNYFLRLPDFDGLERFHDILDGDFVYLDLRDALSPKLIQRLSKMDLSNKWDEKIRMLSVLADVDPIPNMLKLLADDAWVDQNLLLFEFARLADARAVNDIVGMLQHASPERLAESPSTWRNSVQHALKAIAATGTHRAIEGLIQLLSADLSRFRPSSAESSDVRVREELQLRVVEHLIQLTGESFGDDQAAWSIWLEQHPDYHIDLANIKDSQRVLPAGWLDLGSP